MTMTMTTITKTEWMGVVHSLSPALSRPLSLVGSLSLTLSHCLTAVLRDDPVDCQKSCRVDKRPTMGSLSLSLTLSHSRTRAFSRCPALSPSRSLHNQDGIGGSCRLVLRERANGQWRLQEPVCSEHADTQGMAN
mmetsp:Transcript_53276/g.86279  ORF Transcript_53276/g.86279 Transcript_53276/m.86279 type:complete len:135 (-) Transcript_53276:1687-2091(-)